MVATAIRNNATAEDYFKLPEGSRYQLIQGEIIDMPSPRKIHQEVQLELAFQLKQFIKEKPVAEVFIAPMDVHLDNENIYQPDIFLFLEGKNHLMKEDGYHGAPDIVIEVSSNSTVFYDYNKKFKHYEQFGVKEYFIVEPEQKAVYRFDFKDGFFSEHFLGTGVLQSQVLDCKIKF